MARALWHRLEALNAVTYFSSECREAPARLGLRGFWMGYFACRAAPMGAVEAAVVEATFFNFHPERVRRAIPDAWAIVEPKAVLAVRSEAAATALRRVLSDGAADRLAEKALPVLEETIGRATGAGRPLFSANRDTAVPEDSVAALWQAATTLREHRGDSHVALLSCEGLDGCEAHVLFAACEAVPAEMYQQSRGWSAQDWQAAVERLIARRLLTEDGDPTGQGRELRVEIEQRTDDLAVEPYASIREDSIRRLLADLTVAAEQVAASGEITFPNPMGLPREIDTTEI